jgi:hypothetical protein
MASQGELHCPLLDHAACCERLGAPWPVRMKGVRAKSGHSSLQMCLPADKHLLPAAGCSSVRAGGDVLAAQAYSARSAVKYVSPQVMLKCSGRAKPDCEGHLHIAFLLMMHACQHAQSRCSFCICDSPQPVSQYTFYS